MAIDRTNLDAMIDLIKDLSHAEMVAIAYDLHMARVAALHATPAYHVQMLALIPECANRSNLPTLGSAAISDVTAARILAHTTITTGGVAAVFVQVLALPTRTGPWGYGADQQTWPPPAAWPSPPRFHTSPDVGGRPWHPPHGAHQHFNGGGFQGSPLWDCFPPYD